MSKYPAQSKTIGALLLSAIAFASLVAVTARARPAAYNAGSAPSPAAVPVAPAPAPLAPVLRPTGQAVDAVAVAPQPIPVPTAPSVRSTAVAEAASPQAAAIDFPAAGNPLAVLAVSVAIASLAAGTAGRRMRPVLRPAGG